MTKTENTTENSDASASHGAVFLSYASEDIEAAERIATTLRAGGIEVWFDKRELRGGDAWDEKIRREVHDCVLFIPVISANTAARHEGYFRLEWDLADQRTHKIARNRAFIVPVCVDATRETSADTPEAFQRVQWTRLTGGETPVAFVERIQHLLSGEAASPADRARTSQSAMAGASRVPPGLVRRRRAVGYGVIGAAAVLLVGYLALERSRSNSAVQLGGSNSIAVLPLTNESGDASQQYFSDGISEDLITALSQFRHLKVIGRTSSFQFRDSKEDSRSIGAKLGVAHLLEGSVRRSGDVVRVSAELINAEDGSAQWSQRYDRPYKDLFALQDELSRAVAGELTAKLLPGEHAATQSEHPPGGSLEAYNAYLQGRFYVSRNTEADQRKAIGYYTQATELDPRYALAWSELSRAWAGLGSGFLGGAPAHEAYAKARAAADRALTLSPELAAAHLSEGDLLRLDFDWRGAEAEYRRATELAPNDSYAKFRRASLLATFGEVEEAIELTRDSLATEPLQANWYEWLAGYLVGLNRLDEAERAIRRAIELQPGATKYHGQLEIIEIKRGNAQAALATAQQEPPGPGQDLTLALARQIGGDRSAADTALKTLIDNDADVLTYEIAWVYALRNDAKETFAWLDRARSNRDPGIELLLFDPFILRYKDDPRFAAFCRKVGLPVPGEALAGKST
jgi:TolB-like protein/Flp pilus assembly protein TadD